MPEYNLIEKITGIDYSKEVIEFRHKTPDGPMKTFFSNDLETIGYKIESLKKDNHIFFGIAPRKDNTSGKKVNCSSVSALWLDIDCGNDGHKKISYFKTKDEALNHIYRIPFQPTFIIDSGYGFHLYFLLNEKIELNEENISFIETLNFNLSSLYGGDSTIDVSRILRVPGTYNHKLGTPIECNVIRENPDSIFDTSHLKDDDLLKIPFRILKNEKLKEQNFYSILLGQNHSELGKESRSEIDEAIIIKLLKLNFSREMIKKIFQIFPTTGKYHSQSSREEYLTTSINNAQEYLNTKFEYESIVKADSTLPPFYEIISKDNVEIKNAANAGLSNFTLNINRIIRKDRDNKIESSLDGELIFSNKLCLPFKNVSADILYKPDAFESLINHLAPTKPIIYTKTRELLAAINYLNKDVKQIIEREIGYSVDKEEYVTSNIIISKKGFTKEYTPIKYSEIWGNNHLGFSLITEAEAVRLKNEITTRLFLWDKTEVIFSTLAFSFLPIIQPVIADKIPNKFYLMLKGKSGSGKSHLAKICQNFYGTFHNLVSWTSTDTSINIIGNAFKDALFVVDDFKKQNFKNDNAIKNAMAIIQNYSDGTGRQRGNVDLALKDERFIKGWLMISAEDVVFSESSTIARGIILKIDSKEYKPKEAEQILELSKSFKGLMPWFIQFVLSDGIRTNTGEIFEANRQMFFELADTKPEISLDNLSRIINNFALLKTSWDVVSEFLIDEIITRANLTSKYIALLEEVFLDNIFRIDESKSEKIFEQTLWAMIESNKLYFEKICLNKSEYPKSNFGVKIGEYIELKSDEIRIALNLKSAFKEVTKYNSDIQITYDTLKDSLVKAGKIKVNKSEKIFMKDGKHSTGVEWISTYPKNVFGLIELIEPNILSGVSKFDNQPFVDPKILQTVIDKDGKWIDSPNEEEPNIFLQDQITDTMIF